MTPAIVVVHEDGVAAHLVDEAVLQAAVFRAREEDRAAAVDRPVAADQGLLVVHESPGGVAEGQPLEGDEANRGLPGAAELDEVSQSHRFDGRRGQVDVGRGVIVEGVGLGVEEPLAGSVQLLEDVLDEAELPVHGRGPIVLPAALEGDRSVVLLARDDEVQTAPFVAGAWHG